MMLPPSPPAKCLFQDAILTYGRKGAKERKRGADWFNNCIAVRWTGAHDVAHVLTVQPLLPKEASMLIKDLLMDAA
jgi:hypothetical protein